MISLLYLRIAARAWRHTKTVLFTMPLKSSALRTIIYVYTDSRNQRREVSAIFSAKSTRMLATNEANNPKVRVFFWNAVDVLIKANYTEHLCIDLLSTHMLLNTGILPNKRANHSSTRRTPWCWCHESLVAEWWRHESFWYISFNRNALWEGVHSSSDPGLPLAGFRTILPGFQQVNMT